MSELKYYDTNSGQWLPIVVGAQGIQGISGEGIGLPGPQGTQGIQGGNGAQGGAGIGSQGIQGTTGIQGFYGVQGPAGSGAQGVQGTTGIQGAYGTQGVQGGTGSTGASSSIFQYKVKASPLGIDTASGYVAYDDDPQTASTVFYVNDTQTTGVNIDALLAQLTPGDKFAVQDAANPANYQNFTINSSPIDHTTWWAIPCYNTGSGGTGTTNFAAELAVSLITFTAGIPGADGAQGTQGSQGIQGLQGPQGLQGTTGIQGNLGIQGTQGIQGTFGPATVPANTQASSYTAQSSDNGKYIDITSGGVTVGTATAMTAGQNFVVYNDSSSNQTITQGSGVTLRQAGTANTGNRTLAQYGIATVLCVATDTYVIAGTGLS